MAIRLGDVAPNFDADTSEGRINFYEWKGTDWAVLFSHPRDFTPVCTTELGAVARLKPQFDARSTKVIGLSVDPLESHRRWTADIRDLTGQELNFPVIADPARVIAAVYYMIHPNICDTETVRSVFIIGPDNKVKLTLAYPASTGRSFQELLRVLDSLQLSAAHPVATPADWRAGEDVIIVLSQPDEQVWYWLPEGLIQRGHTLGGMRPGVLPLSGAVAVGPDEVKVA